MKKKSHIIAVVGMTGSGKSVVSDYLVSKGYQFLRCGQITLDIIKKKGLKPSEENEKIIREGIRKEHGMAAYAIMNKEKIDKMLKKGNVVIDGLYSWSEYKFLKNVYQDDFKVLAIISDPETRYQRLEKRKEIDEKMRHRPASREQAMSRDYAEIENIEKGGPIAMADYVVINSGTKEELIEKIKNIFECNRRLEWDEYFMQIVHAVSKRATCDRGKTACIIVKNKRIIATGYVGSPIGLPHCDEVGHLYEMRYDEQGNKTEHCIRTIHAEQNAIAQAAKYGISVDGATLYMKLEPCFWCAKQLINAGIKRIVCEKRYHGAKLTRHMLKQAGVKLEVLHDEMATYDRM